MACHGDELIRQRLGARHERRELVVDPCCRRSVGRTERIPESPYLRAKNAQETLIKSGGIPYSIVHATQFFEFIKRIADEASDGTTGRRPPVLIQPLRRMTSSRRSAGSP